VVQKVVSSCPSICSRGIPLHAYTYTLIFFPVVLESELTDVKDCLHKTELQLNSKVLELKLAVEKVR